MSIPFLYLEVRLVRARGPLQWRAPATVTSNSHPGQRDSVPLILFLREVGRRLPPAATVTVLVPHAGLDSSSLYDLVAIGQLPRNDVVSAVAYVERNVPPPRFLAIELGDLSDDRYRLVAALPTGRLYELQR